MELHTAPLRRADRPIIFQVFQANLINYFLFFLLSCILFFTISFGYTAYFFLFVIEVGDFELTNGRQVSFSSDVNEEILDNFQKSSADINEDSVDSIFYNALSEAGC